MHISVVFIGIIPVIECGTDQRALWRTKRLLLPENLCKGAFKCHESAVCVHLADTCNGPKDCPFGDDTFFCALSISICPSGCNCPLYAAQSQNQTITSVLLLQSLPFEIMLLKNCTFATVDIQHILWKSIKFSMTYYNLETVCESLHQMELLSHLNIGFNSIRNVENNCYKRNSELKLLELNNNLISKIHNNGLWKLQSLISIDLSSNHLSTFASASFVVISQTHWLVSQERLFLRVGTSVFIDLIPIMPSGEVSSGSKFTAGVSHHTPPPVGGVGSAQQFLIFSIFLQ